MPSEEDLDRDPIKSVTSQSQVSSSSTTNPTIMTMTTTTASSSRQPTNSKDDASIASGSSGCGSLTKKTKPQIATGKELN